MKVIIGMLIGAVITWALLSTAGKQYITQTIRVTETNWVTQTETNYTDVARWVTQTNIVWQTNVVEKIVQKAPAPIVSAPAVQKTIEQPKIVRPAIVQPTTTTPITETPTGLRKAIPAGKVTIGTPAIRDMKVKTRKDMDGNIKK